MFFRLAGYLIDVTTSPAFDVEAESVFFLRGTGESQLVEMVIERVKPSFHCLTGKGSTQVFPAT
jgi:hypothetical protein